MEVTPCSVEGCEDPVDRKGYCKIHYARQWRWGTTGLVGPQPKPCSRCGTTFQPQTNRAIYCSDHCRRAWATCGRCEKTFQVPKGASGKYCSRECWYAMDLGARPCPICNASFKGGAKTCSPACGRRLRMRTHPSRRANCEQCGSELVGKKPFTRFCSRSCSMKARVTHGGSRLPDGSRRSHASGYVNIKVDGRWVLEHRVVMEQVLSRPLESHERIHHRNGRRDDNRPENLELWKVTKKDPAGVRAADYHCAGCRCGEERLIDESSDVG